MFQSVTAGLVPAVHALTAEPMNMDGVRTLSLRTKGGHDGLEKWTNLDGKPLLQVLDLIALLAADGLRERRGHEGVKVAVEDVARRAAFDAGAQVLHELVGLKHVGADLMAPADVGFLADEGAGLGLLLLELDLVEARAQHVPARRAVLVLRALGLAGDRDARRQMGDAHRALGLVDV